jgi:hypothetical protein
MKKSKIIFLALKVFEKNWDFDDLVDYVGRYELAEKIWGFVNEIENIGKIKFKEKYRKMEMTNPLKP